jgi:hypothetical protein
MRLCRGDVDLSAGASLALVVAEEPKGDTQVLVRFLRSGDRSAVSMFRLVDEESARRIA